MNKKLIENDELINSTNSNEKISESIARSCIADSIRYTLVKLFYNISENKYHTGVDFSDLSDDELIEFSLATTGFMSLQNFESMSNSIDDRELDKIIKGTFNLRPLTKEETDRFLEFYNTKFKTHKDHLVAPLCNIQDSNYSIKSKYTKNNLVLTTPEPEYHSNKTKSISSSDFFKIIRNLTAHGMFYLNGPNVVYFKDDDYIAVPKMWLRGYSELFVKQKPEFDSALAREILIKKLPETNNTLSNEAEINKALSLIRNLFNADTLKNFYRVNNFVNSRLKYQPIFFKVSLEDKIELLINILEANPNFIKQANETINPIIIYNLKQLVSQELEDRETKTDPSQNLDIQKGVMEIITEYEILQKQIEFYKTQKNISLYNDAIKKCDAFLAKNKALKDKIASHEKLSTSNMDFYDPNNLQYLPIETSVNLIALLAYTDLVVSSFYEDTLKNTDYNNLTDAQKHFFSNFDLSKLTYIYKGKKYEIKDPTNTCYALRAIRNAICHKLISYKFPSLKQNETASFKDVELTFYSDIEDIQVVGSIDAFFEILANNNFTKERNSNVITQESPQVRVSVPDIPKIKITKTKTNKASGLGE